jgi:ectoine hydroxylase-related dioxygenase (phytanoyl-CoA dioxygenase family)
LLQIAWSHNDLRFDIYAMDFTEDQPRFEANDPALADYFAAQGYVVIKAAATPQEVEHGTGLLWRFLEKETDMREDNSLTWDFPHDLGYAHLGIMNSLGFNHSELCWFVRQLPKVREAYSQIWKTNDLICSFDGGNLFLPWHADESQKTTDGWFHVDQGRTRRGLQGVQGLVALTDATPHTGGLLVVAGSHKQHDELVGNRRDDGDFVVLSGGDCIDTSTARLITCKAGDLIMW